MSFLLSILCLHMVSNAQVELDKIKLPPGFKISVHVPNIPSARSMTWSPSGNLYVGTRESSVYVVTPEKKVRTIATGLNMPNGVAFRNGALYVAEVSRILRYDHIEKNLDKPPKPVVLTSDFPTDTHHGWKFIAFGPDDRLYVPVGAPCNICEKNDPYSSITSVNAEGKDRKIFARGVRNTVGFDWHPVTKELWFTDNGRDMMGDDIPPDELNRAPKAEMHFGYPYCHGGHIADPEFGQKRKCSEFTAPAQNLGPHVASLGMRFYTGKMFPEEYQNQIFIAEHGSWNRSQPLGYRITLAKLDRSGKVTSYSTFAEGWLGKGGVWGRPVDVIVDRDGALLVSDDKAGVIYRIVFEKK